MLFSPNKAWHISHGAAVCSAILSELTITHNVCHLEPHTKEPLCVVISFRNVPLFIVHWTSSRRKGGALKGYTLLNKNQDLSLPTIQNTIYVITQSFLLSTGTDKR